MKKFLIKWNEKFLQNYERYVEARHRMLALKNHTCLTLNWCNSSWFSPLPIGGKEAVEAHNLGGCLQQKSVQDTFKNCPRIAVWPTLCTLLNLRRCNLVLSLFPHKILCPCAKTDSGNNSNVRKGRHDVASAHHKGKCASSSLNFVVSILETRAVLYRRTLCA